MHLFVYGTLMVPEVMAAVCGYDSPGRPATLNGYRRRRVFGESYPAIAACGDESVDGILYPGVSTGQLARLDAFEGALYRRSPVMVTAGDAATEATAYVVADPMRVLLTEEHWSLDTFVANHLDTFMSEYEGFVSLR